MKKLTTILLLCIAFIFKATGQIDNCPKVSASIKMQKDTFLAGDDIRLTMTLTNYTTINQRVWFKKSTSSLGCPPWTSVSLTNKKNSRSVLKYNSRGILESQSYSEDEINKLSDQLKPGQSIYQDLSLYNLVVLENNTTKLNKGTYVIQLFYCSSKSNIIEFTIK